jgi:RNA polymerase sigma factor (TIGR02999 family)
MRHILINYAKRRRRQKRGGDRPRLSLEELKVAASDEVMLSEERAEVLVVLDEALKRLEQENPRQSRIVECRFFGGMTIQETAAALEVSPMTVKRGWAVAQLWLLREMEQLL